MVEQSRRAAETLSRRALLSRAGLAGTAAAAAGSLPAAEPAAGADVAVPERTLAPGPAQLTLRVNGRPYPVDVEPRTTLLDALREELGLTGTKKGCNQGACGACTVLVDGRRVNSCLTLAVMQRGAEITTIEGLADGDGLHPVQQAFLEHDAFQCGYCTPGQIMSGTAVIAEGHAGSPEEVREWMSGNICRCGAYPNIVAAVCHAARDGRR